MEIQRYNFQFKGIRCSVWIKALCGEKYEIMFRTEKELSKSDQQALLSYLENEGYIYRNDITLE